MHWSATPAHLSCLPNINDSCLDVGLAEGVQAVWATWGPHTQCYRCAVSSEPSCACAWSSCLILADGLFLQESAMLTSFQRLVLARMRMTGDTTMPPTVGCIMPMLGPTLTTSCCCCCVSRCHEYKEEGLCERGRGMLVSCKVHWSRPIIHARLAFLVQHSLCNTAQA